MGAAAYIGRVGSLAVALGVGSAIATGQGVALAEATDSASPNSSTADTSSDADTATGTDPSSPSNTTSPSTQASTEPSPETPETTALDSEESESTSTSTTVGDGVVVSAQTNTGTSTTETTDETDESETPVETDESGQTDVPEESEPDEADEADEGEGGTEPTDNTEQQPQAVTPEPPAADSSRTSSSTGASTPTAAPSATTSARAIQSAVDPGAPPVAADTVATFADARTLAAAGPINVSPMMSAQTAERTAVTTTAPAAPDLLRSAVNVVSSVVNWVLNPLAGTAPSTPAQPPLIWGLLAFARREFDNFFGALGGRTPSEALTDQAMTTMALAAANSVDYPPPARPYPGQHFSDSTQFVRWVTGRYQYADPDEELVADTLTRYSVYGTDLGIMWDNGIPDDPTTEINEHQVLIAVGDTFGGPNMSGDWRPNTIFRSSDTDLSNGMDIPDGQWYTGNMFGGAPLGPDGYPTRARQVIFPEGLPAGVTLIPTAGISVPDPDSEYGAIQYVSFMSVTQWGNPGSWTTNYSAIAWSDDNGETFHVAPETVRYNQPWSGNQNFQQSAFVRSDDGYVYVYGTPNGRQGSAYVARVAEEDILDLREYEYYSAGSKGGWFGWGAKPAGWYKNDPSQATAIFGRETGACGAAKAGNQVSEMSVQYNEYLGKYVVLHGDQFNNIVMRTADRPEGTWSSPTVLMAQQPGGIYAPMMHPWSPSTTGTGSDLYWNLSLWSEYNVMLVHTDLTKV